RSPFGIRNIKLYIDEFPLTDAGGNTYLNSLDAGGIKNIEILKGPEGSLFGANTGGVVLISPLNHAADSTQASLSLSGGSFGLFNEKASIDQQWKKYRMNVYQAYQRSDGYRENSALQRLYFQTMQQFNYSATNHLKFLAIYSDMKYQTPGGLTLDQYEANPRAARLAAGPFAGATDQKAAVYNKTSYLGISHEAAIGKRLRHVLTLFGSHTDFKNPFITNYEVRTENTGGLRTYLEWKNQWRSVLQWKWNVGLEAQQTSSTISDYGNALGAKDTLQTSDDLIAQQHFFFTQLSIDLLDRWIIEAAVSLNDYRYHYKNNYPAQETNWQQVHFTPQLLPRIALSYKMNKSLVWRASASKGYSPPTLAEIRPSTNSIYTNLQPEAGWNYESGVRVQSQAQGLQIDLVFFYFQLQQAIVRRQNASGADYFVNAGGTNQKGMELQLFWQLIKPNELHFIKGLQFRNSLTYYDFSFSEYQVAGANYSGNHLTGVPQATVVTSIRLDLLQHYYLFVQHYYTDRIPLDDANSVYAGSYHLVQLKIGCTYHIGHRAKLDVFAGVDNLLNAHYSLGNDLNATGGRYYNAAPGRNYYAGATFNF
ncbi:MAG: yncD, partial [Chitinophagaceae bacterium]|nr:yncD [Chitinophagaceae bacterium]